MKNEVFREYTDCLCAGYSNRWNGNSASFNGSLFVLTDDKLRRLTPRECERLQGFPDDYTYIKYEGKESSDSARYQALGNSWAVPVIRWIGTRINELVVQ